MVPVIDAFIHFSLSLYLVIYSLFNIFSICNIEKEIPAKHPQTSPADKIFLIPESKAAS
jgi:hypothetical protein